MDTERKFRTKTGFCHILDDKIVLTRDGIIGDISKITVGNSITRTLIIYGLLSIGFLYYAYESYIEKDILFAVFFLLIVVFLIYGILSSLNNSATPIIERKSIQEIRVNKGISGLTRARFEVLFIDENGKTKKRLIMLPGSFTGGHTETDIALRIMTEEKLL